MERTSLSLWLGFIVLLSAPPAYSNSVMKPASQPGAPAQTQEQTSGAAENASLSQQTGLERSGAHALRHKDYEKAKLYFQRALEKNPSSLPAELGMAKALYELRQYKEALALIDNALPQLKQLDSPAINDRLRHNFSLTRGKILHRLQRFDEAAEELSKAIKCKGDNTEALDCRATVYDALDKPEKAIADLTKAIEQNPNNANRYLQRALLFRRLGKQEEALSDFDKAVKLNPQLISWRASFNRDQGHNDDAISDYSQAIDLQSGRDKASEYFNRGAIYEDLDQHRKAIDDFTNALEITPDAPQYYAHRGTSYFGVSDFPHAIEDFSKAIELDKNADYYYRRANAYAEEKQLEMALADYNEAIKLEGNQHPVFYLKRADLKSELGNHAAAIADIDKAIAMSKNDPELYFDRGLEYAASGDTQKSAEDMSRCISIKPDYAGAYKNRALARLKLGDKAGAVQDLEESAQLYRSEGDRHGSAEIARLMESLK